MKIMFSKLSDQEKQDLVMLHYCCTGDGLKDSQYDNKIFKIGNKKISAQEAREIELEITKEDCVELMKSNRLATGVMPLIPKEYCADAEFLHALAEAYGGADSYIYEYATEDLKNNPDFVMPIIEKHCKGGAKLSENFVGIVGRDLKNNRQFIESLVRNPDLNCEFLLRDMLAPMEFHTNGVLEMNPIIANDELMTECVSADSHLFENLVTRRYELTKNEDFMMTSLISIMNQQGVRDMAIMVSKLVIDPENFSKYGKEIAKIVNASKKYLKADRNEGLISTCKIKFYEAAMRSYVSSVEKKLAQEKMLQAEASLSR